ncbi:MAG: hypothetical protein HZA50_11800 [Planctomycetes bacterium]|nr:hypothetical protein [Planctomycetota bacterium]
MNKIEEIESRQRDLEQKMAVIQALLGPTTEKLFGKFDAIIALLANIWDAKKP